MPCPYCLNNLVNVYFIQYNTRILFKYQTFKVSEHITYMNDLFNVIPCRKRMQPIRFSCPILMYINIYVSCKNISIIISIDIHVVLPLRIIICFDNGTLARTVPHFGEEITTST